MACQERNQLCHDLVPDFFTCIQQDEFFGWPFAYMTPDLTDPPHMLPNGTSVHVHRIFSLKLIWSTSWTTRPQTWKFDIHRRWKPSNLSSTIY